MLAAVTLPSMNFKTLEPHFQFLVRIIQTKVPPQVAMQSPPEVKTTPTPASLPPLSKTKKEVIQAPEKETPAISDEKFLAPAASEQKDDTSTPIISADASETVQKSMAAAPQKIEQQASKNASNEAKNARSQYGLLLSQEIAKFKQYPPFAKQSKQQGVVLVQVQIDGLGKLIAVNLYQSSNHELLDNQALAMVRKASPFSKPPPDIENKDLNLVIPITFNLN
jgi:protein TonB